jgi:hypothetical protein
MKTTSKNTFGLILILCGVYILTGCGEDYVVPNGYCDVLTEFTIDKEIGRVYYYNSPDDRTPFYYIGNPDTTYSWGGHIPCNSLPEAYIPEGDIGVLVRYSGRIKSYSLDPEEPLFWGIEITFIEMVDED